MKAIPRLGLALAMATTLGACDRWRGAPTNRGQNATAPTAVDVRDGGPPDPGPVRTEELAVDGDLPAFVVRGGPGGGTPMVFVPGMCVHPAGYVMSFQHAAAVRGDLVAVQGDVSCNDAYGGRRWSSDLVAMDARIRAAFRAAGLGEPRGVTIIGYSQGAERAERLVARFPERYSAAVLVASPVVPSPALLAKADAVVLAAGQLDLAQGTHPAAAARLRKASIPSTFLTLPGARHGQMGTTPEASMAEALDFVEEARRVKHLR